jgi:hypothetical protein
MENLYRDLVFIRKVIMSCKTEEQRKNAYEWSVRWKDNMMNRYDSMLVSFGWHLIMSDI